MHDDDIAGDGIPQSAKSTWWSPTSLEARRARLAVRASVKAAIGHGFAARGFTEVETPALQVSPGLEPHLVAFETALQGPGGAGEPQARYLHTSPEFAMKKLLAGGMDRIWQFHQ